MPVGTLNTANTVKSANAARQPQGLERIRLSGGATALLRTFVRTVKRDRGEATRLLKDEDLSFPAVYIIAPVAEEHGLTGELPYRAAYAMYLSAMKWNESGRAALYLSVISSVGSEPEPPLETLQWMLRTGTDWDGPSSSRDSYDAAIDAAAALLADGYDDTETLCKVADLLFRRNRRGGCIHDLTWALFHTADPGALLCVAKRLTSDSARDVELACRLMGFDDPGTRAGRRKLLDEYSAWLTENRPYLYATNEHFNSTSTPYHVRHDREAKMLMREIDPRSRSPVEPLTEDEYNKLVAYRKQLRELK